MPFPSQGCRTCRQRRIKCDETRPACGQCKRSARICMGFEVEQSSLHFRSENTYASGVARRPRRPNAKGSQKATRRSQITSRSSPKTALEQIPRTLDLPLEDLAFNYYVQNHIFAEEHFSIAVQGWLERTILAHQHARTDSLLAPIVSAVSLTIFGRTKASTEAILLGRCKYVRALSKTITVVGNADEAITDQFLLTVMMLGVHEHAVANYDKKFLLAESFRHQNGAIAILRLRKARNGIAGPLEKLVRHMIIKQAILHAVALPEWIWDGAEFGEEGVHLGLDSCLVKLALLRNRAQELWRDAVNFDRKNLQPDGWSIVAEARSIDRTLANWSANLPKNWIYTTQGESSPCEDFRGTEGYDPERLQYGSTLSLYPNLEQAATWNRYQASRIITDSIIRRLLSYDESASLPYSDDSCNKLRLVSSLQLAARKDVQEHVDDICASVPYHFGVTDINSDISKEGQPQIEIIAARRVDLLSWPLTVAMAAGDIPEHQRQWIRSKILLIGKITGNGALNLIANMDQHINLKERYS